MNLIERLFERHKLVRRATLVWAAWLITAVILRVTEPAMFMLIGTSQATFLLATVGILATVIGFYHRVREQDERKDEEYRKWLD